MAEACHRGDVGGFGAPCDSTRPCRAFFACVQGFCREAPSGDDAGDASLVADGLTRDGRDSGTIADDASTPPGTPDADRGPSLDADERDSMAAGDTIGDEGGTIRDLSAETGMRVSGRLAVGLDSRMGQIERIGVRSPLRHFLLFERVNHGAWSVRDNSFAAPNTTDPCNDLETIADVGDFSISGNNRDLYSFWDVRNQANELLLFMSYNNAEWECLNVSHNARGDAGNELIRGVPQRLTPPPPLSVIASLGPSGEILLFRWGLLPVAGGDDWKVRVRIGDRFTGMFTTWQDPNGVHSFAVMRDFTDLTIFRMQAVDQWAEEAFRPLRSPGFVGEMVGWADNVAEHLVGVSLDHHLVLFDRSGSNEWATTDVTAVDRATAIGRPARYRIPGTSEDAIVARNEIGHLLYHWRDALGRWRAHDLSQRSQGEELVFGDPAAWSVPDSSTQPEEAVVAEGSGQRLLIFEGLANVRALVSGR
jgi:hypothetical protein